VGTGTCGPEYSDPTYSTLSVPKYLSLYVSRETTLIKYILKNINILWYIISIIGKIFESSFLINLLEDTNVTYILYKSSQTYGHRNRKQHLIGDGGSMYEWTDGAAST
jgi:hypothetical protein